MLLSFNFYFFSTFFFANSIIRTFFIFLFSSIESLWLLRWLHSYKSTTMFTFFFFIILLLYWKPWLQVRVNQEETQSSIYSWITIFKSFNLYSFPLTFKTPRTFSTTQRYRKKEHNMHKRKMRFFCYFISLYFLGLVILSVVIFFYHNI